MSVSTQSSSTAARRLVAYCVGGLRLATLAQMLPSVPTSIGAADRPVLTGIGWMVAVGMHLLIAAVVLTRGTPVGPRLAAADTAVAVVLIGIGTVTVPTDLRLGTWEGYHVAYTLSVGCSLVGVRGRGLWLGMLLTLGVAELIYLAPLVEEVTDLPRLLGNLLTLLVLGPLMWVGAGIILRIGEEADEAKDYAAAVARAEEERRARLAIHNGTALLRLLVDHDDTDPGTGDPGDPTRDRLRSQAEAEINRMRAYLAGTTAPVTGPVDLAALVSAVAGEFADLPITVVADLARGVRLGPELADDLGNALRSLLLNVRAHAGASRVVLHAEEPADGGGWVVTLHDDGVGFDPGSTPQGVGLRSVVIEQLATHGVTTALDSIPQIGTTVTLSHRPAGHAGPDPLTALEA